MKSGLKILALGLVLALVLSLGLSGNALAQGKPKASPAAKVSQTIGAANEITIVYHRPGVKGRDVWADKSDNAQIGSIVPRDGDPRPWRAGANNATTITFTKDVTVEGKALAAGTYALFIIPTDGDWTVIFNNDAKSWGSFRYKKENDALRVSVKTETVPHQERLAYGFENLADWSATAFLHWEKVKVPFRIETKEGG